MRTPSGRFALCTVVVLVVVACQPQVPAPPVDEPVAPEETTEPATEGATPDDEGDGDAVGAAWHEIAEAPIEPRINHSLTWTDDVFVVWGGESQDSGAIKADGAAYDPQADEWERVAEAPLDARWAHHAMWTGDELLVFGGSAGPDHLADCYTDGALWDPATDTWREIPPAPGEPRCGAAVAWADGLLVVVGGHVGQGPPGPGDRKDSAVAFDVDDGSWRELADPPLDPRADSLAVWTGDEVIVYGGHALADDEAGYEYRTDAAAYDPATDEWREVAQGPLPARAGIHGVWTGEALIVLGGDDPDPAVSETQRPTAMYDPAADSWQSLADEPRSSGTFAATWAHGVLYVLGSGAPQDPNGDGSPDIAPFVAYSVDDDRWDEQPDPPDGRRMHHAMAWGGQDLIVWGGQLEDSPAHGLRWGP